MTEIRDGAYGFISGTVTRVFSTKNGPASEIEVKPLDRDGNSPKYGDKWVAWGLELTEGERVTVKGWISTRAETFTNQQGEVKAATKRNINNAEVTAREAGINQQAGGQPQTTSGEGWATPAAPEAQTGAWASTEVPF